MAMKKYLCILCEGETDEMFYERLTERVTAWNFEKPMDFRLRRGANFKTALAKARLLLNRLRHWKDQQDVCVVIAVDNDRAPGNPGARDLARVLPPFDRKKEARYPALVKMVEERLGVDRAGWPVQVALAMPVEMIESWLLVLIDPERGELPLFSRADDQIARVYHGKNPPLQLKDLRDAEAKKRGVRVEELFFEVADIGDLERLAAREGSFAMFKAELEKWG